MPRKCSAGYIKWPPENDKQVGSGLDGGRDDNQEKNERTTERIKED